MICLILMSCPRKPVTVAIQVKMKHIGAYTQPWCLKFRQLKKDMSNGLCHVYVVCKDTFLVNVVSVQESQCAITYLVFLLENPEMALCGNQTGVVMCLAPVAEIFHAIS